MNTIRDDVNDKITNISNRFDYITKNYSGNFNNLLLLYEKMKYKLEEIEYLIDEFEIGSKNDLEINLELEKRIKENKKQKDIIKAFSPYILLYQLNHNNI